MADWMPMDTAPRGGRGDFLVVCKENGCRYISVYADVDEDVIEEMTHWMPLPRLPADTPGVAGAKR